MKPEGLLNLYAYDGDPNHYIEPVEELAEGVWMVRASTSVNPKAKTKTFFWAALGWQPENTRWRHRGHWSMIGACSTPGRASGGRHRVWVRTPYVDTTLCSSGITNVDVEAHIEGEAAAASLLTAIVKELFK